MVEEIRPVSLERFSKVRQTVKEVIAQLPVEKINDRGELRYRVSRRLIEQDKNLPPEKQKAIRERGLRRYLEYHLGVSEIHGHLEAVHAKQPEAFFFAMKQKFPGLTTREIIELSRQANDQAREYQQARPGLFVSEVLAALRDQAGEQEQEKLRHLFVLMNRFDEKTDKIVLEAAAQSQVSLILPQKSRLIADLARESQTRETDHKLTPREYALGAREAYWQALRAVMTNTGLLNEAGKLTAPFLQISLHGMVAQVEEAELVIGAGMKNGQLPLEPEIARWLEGKLTAKIQSSRILNKEGNLARVRIAIEGEPLCGASANCQCRHGDGERHAGFSEMLQVAQLEIDRSVRKQHLSALGEIMAEVLTEFSAEFPNRTALENYISQNQTEADQKRRQGVISVNTVSSERIKPDKVGLPQVFRTALGVKPGDQVMINGQEYDVVMAPKDLAAERAAVLGKGVEAPVGVDIKKIINS